MFEEVCKKFNINNRVIGKTEDNGETSNIKQNSILRTKEINNLKIICI